MKFSVIIVSNQLPVTLQWQITTPSKVPKHVSNISAGTSRSRGPGLDGLCDTSNLHERGTPINLGNTADSIVATHIEDPTPAVMVFTWVQEMPDLEDLSVSEEEDSDEEPLIRCDEIVPQPPHSATPPLPPASWRDDELPSLPDMIYDLDDDFFGFDEGEDDENHTLFQEFRDPEGCNALDDGDEEEAAFISRKGVFVFPPTLAEAESAFEDITRILKPPRAKGRGYKDPGLDRVTTVRLEGIRMFLGTYTRFEKAKPGCRGN